MVLSGEILSKAPWTDEQVERLFQRQQSNMLHPYTCVTHSFHALTPTNAGWVCDIPECEYTQDWAHGLDVNESEWWNNVGDLWDKLEDA
jgi:hypothetical protein